MTRLDISAEPTRVSVIQVPTPDLGDHSYVAVVGDRAVAVDPQRDIDRVIAALGDATLVAVFETHIHNDYVTGGHLLAGRLGADYVLPADSGASIAHTPIADGEEFGIGDGWLIRAVHTPGHTMNHTSYELVGPTGPAAVFTGGSMLVGAVGRSDLLGPDLTERLARLQFRSVNALADDLPGPTYVAPTHGAGSFCSASAVAATTSTIDLERGRNPALIETDEDAFVHGQIANYRLHPAYYAHMGPVNLVGVAAIDADPLEELAPADLDGLDAEIVDLRPARAWAAGHIPGSLSVPSRDDTAQYIGWVLPWNRPVVLVGEPERVEEVRLRLARIGHDAVAGAITDGLAAWREEGRAMGTARVAGFDELAAETPGVVVDVRDPLEYADGHFPEAIDMHVSRFATEAVPGEPGDDVWLYCATGYRASVAAGFVERSGRAPVIVLDDWDERGRALASGV